MSKHARTSTRTRRKGFALGGAAVALTGVTLAGFVVLNSGGSAQEHPARELHLSLAADVRGTTAAAAPVPEAATQRQGRNPFKALYVVPVGGSGGTPTTGPVTSGPSGPGGPVGSPSPAPTVPANPRPTPTPSTPAPTTPPPTTPPPTKTQYTVVFEAFGAKVGTIRTTLWKVDGAPQTVLRGQRFGKYGELVVLSYPYVDGVSEVALQVADNAPVTIAPGTTITITVTS